MRLTALPSHLEAHFFACLKTVSLHFDIGLLAGEMFYHKPSQLHFVVFVEVSVFFVRVSRTLVQRLLDAVVSLGMTWCRSFTIVVVCIYNV